MELTLIKLDMDAKESQQKLINLFPQINPHPYNSDIYND